MSFGSELATPFSDPNDNVVDPRLTFEELGDLVRDRVLLLIERLRTAVHDVAKCAAEFRPPAANDLK